MNSLINKIVKKNIHCYFISPHFDDAVLSSGGLMLSLSDKVPISVINVFTKADRGPYTLSAKMHLRKNKFKDARILYGVRNNEDKKILGKLGVERINLGFIEALYRKKSIDKASSLMGKLIPEITHVYPIFRLHVVGENMSGREKELESEISEKLKKLVKKESIVFCPLGLGGHIDHIIVRDVCLKNFKNLVFWFDFPYSEKEPKTFYSLLEEIGLEVFSFKNNLKKKKEMVLGYKSQVMNLFKNKDFSLPPEKFLINKVSN